MRWRILPQVDSDIFRQLAIEEALAQVAGKLKDTNTIRFWRNHKSVVIGRLQCVHKEVHIDFCNEKGIDIARRITGGGAVFHDKGNLNFTLCMIQKDVNVPRTLPDIYSKYLQAIASGLHKIQIPISYDDNGYCLRIGKKKVTGTAGWLKRGVAFIHGTLLISSDLDELNNALDPPKNQQIYVRDNSRVRCKASRRDIVTNIADEVKDCPSIISIIEAITQSIEDFINEPIVEEEFTEEEVNTTQSLYEMRYTKPEWNMGKPLSEESSR
jgi:lipoate-protein ligase A